MKPDALSPTLHDRLALTGLQLAPPQVLGGVRLVPLLRDQPPGDLRLVQRTFAEDVALVRLDRRTSYYSYIPHALVASWTTDGAPVAAFGTQFQSHADLRRADAQHANRGFLASRVLSKLRMREDSGRLRFVPQHLAMEGFLALQFRGPDVAWEEYSRTALREGLSPRSETTVPGRLIVGLEDALRVFEIHTTQVGMLLFVADALAAAFVVPHPEDYRALHETLLTDFYGELIHQYSWVAVENVYQPSPIDADRVHSMADLRAELSRLRRDWSALHERLSARLIDRPLRTEVVYEMGPFRLQRFMTDLDPNGENHLGEAIVRQDGSLEYLKTYRLSGAQCRRAYLLRNLAESQWSLETCAARVQCSKDELIVRLDNAGFGYLLKPHILEAARKRRR